MTQASDVRAMLSRSDQLPWGPEERALLAEAVAAAASIGDEELEYAARMRQTASANMSGDIELTLNSFAWCLARHDSDPARFPAEVDGNDLMWHFKWMAGNLRANAAFSNEQISAVLDDMETHYRRAGLGLSGVHMARFESAWSQGLMDEAEEHRLVLEATPRDSHSHCEACVRSQQAGFFVEMGRPYDAIHLVDEMVDGDFTCAEEPEYALARVMLSLLRAGRDDDARAAHLRSYRLAQGEEDKLAIIALHLEFAAVTGNEARALSMLERHISWLGHDGLNEDAHLAALGAFGLTLDAVDEAGHGDITVRGADAAELVRFFGEHDGEWSAADLAVAAWQAADALAARFDARNGNSAASERVAAQRMLPDEGLMLPLSGETFVREPAVIPTTTPDERWHRAVNLADWGDAPGAIAASELALADHIAAHQSRLHGIIVGAHAAREDWDAAEAALLLRAAALRAEGDDATADIETELGMALYGRGTADDVAAVTAALERDAVPDAVRADLELALASAAVDGGDFATASEHARRAVEHLRAAGLPDRAATAQSVVLTLRAGSGDADVSAEIADALASPDTSAGTQARLLDLRARLRGASDDHAGASIDADTAVRITTMLGVRSDLTGLHSLAAMLRHDADDLPGAIARYRVAVRHAEREQSPQLLTLKYQLGVSLLAVGEAVDATDLLTDVLLGEQEAGVDAASRAQTSGALAQAFEADERASDAMHAWMLTAALFEEAGDDLMQAHAHLHTGRILGRLGEHEESINRLERAVVLARALGDQAELLARALHLLGQAQGNAGLDAAYDQFREAETVATTEGLGWLVADIVDSRGRVHAQRGDTDAAVASLLQAGDAFIAAGDPDAAAGSELYAARVLAANARPADSVPLFRAALEHTTDVSGLRQAAAIELGDALASLGRHAEAAEARRLADQA